MSFFNITIKKLDGLNNFNLVEISGDVNIHYRNELEKFFKFRLKNEYSNYIIYFNDVTYIDSIGLAIIIDFYRKIVKSKKDFYIVNNSETVEKVFSLTGLLDILNINSDLEALLNKIKEENG